MQSIKEIIQDLTKSNEEIYSKIGTVIEINGKLCNVRLLDNSILYNVRCAADPTSTTWVEPILTDKVIVTFLSREDAFISAQSSSASTVIETTDPITGDKSSFKIINEAGKAIAKFEGMDSFSVNTKNGGKLSIQQEETNDTFIIEDVNSIILGITDGSQISIDDTGIDITSVNTIKLSNNISSLKDILDNIIDTLLTVPLVPLVPTVVLDPATILQLQTIKSNIASLLS